MKIDFLIFLVLFSLMTSCNSNSNIEIDDSTRSGNSDSIFRAHKNNLKDIINKSNKISENFQIYSAEECIKKKDYQNAILHYSNALTFDTLNIRAYYGRGFAKAQLFDHKHAIKDFDRVLEIDPNNGQALAFKGLSKIKIGQKNSGCLDLNKAGELGFSFAYQIIDAYCN